MLYINEKTVISQKYIRISFIRSRGPGGQNVNKVNTRAQLTFNLAECPELPSQAKKRLAQIAGRRLTSRGQIIIESDRYREQNRNRLETLSRLRSLIRQSFVKPKPRIPTRPTKASKQRHLRDKQHRSRNKSLRKNVSSDEL